MDLVMLTGDWERAPSRDPAMSFRQQWAASQLYFWTKGVGKNLTGVQVMIIPNSYHEWLLNVTTLFLTGVGLVLLVPHVVI